LGQALANSTNPHKTPIKGRKMTTRSAPAADNTSNNLNPAEYSLASEPPPAVEGDVAHRIREVEEVVNELAWDVAAAEFIAATELAEDIGIEMEFQARLRKISSEQWQYLLEDLQATATEIQSARTALSIMGSGIRHLNRRIQHQQEGWLAFLQCLYIEQKKRIDTHNQLLEPFFASFAKDAVRQPGQDSGKEPVKAPARDAG
jgi:hypothetical protein